MNNEMKEEKSGWDFASSIYRLIASTILTFFLVSFLFPPAFLYRRNQAAYSSRVVRYPRAGMLEMKVICISPNRMSRENVGDFGTFQASLGQCDKI